jgi:hypothetical protein
MLPCPLPPQPQKDKSREALCPLLLNPGRSLPEEGAPYVAYGALARCSCGATAHVLRVRRRVWCLVHAPNVQKEVPFWPSFLLCAPPLNSQPTDTTTGIVEVHNTYFARERMWRTCRNASCPRWEIDEMGFQFR